MQLHSPWPLPGYPSSSSFSSWKVAVCSLAKTALVTAQKVQVIAMYFLKGEDYLLGEEEGKLNQWEALMAQVVQIELADPLMKQS